MTSPWWSNHVRVTWIRISRNVMMVLCIVWPNHTSSSQVVNVSCIFPKFNFITRVSHAINNSCVCKYCDEILLSTKLFCCNIAISRHGTILTFHYNDVIMGTIASQITSLTIVYSTVYSDADQRKQQSSASLAFMRGIQRWPVNSKHKWPVTRKMFYLMTSLCK